jgi:hypothetical protein
VLKLVAFKVPAEPRALLKYPSFSPTRADAWVMLVRKPSETVTGAPPPDPPDVELEPELAELADEEEQPASRRAVPIIAAAVTRRIQ